MDKSDSYITTAELCEWLNVTKTTAMNWRNEGMPHYGKGRVFLYKKGEVEKWLMKRNKKD